MCSGVSAGRSSNASLGSGGAAGSELRCGPAVPPGLRAGVHRVSGDGRVRSSLVRRHQERTDGVSDQEASGRGGNAVWEGPDLSAGEVCG